MILLLILPILFSTSHAVERTDGRFSFSLTTFDPDGRLEQVERAVRATLLGSPVVAVCGPDHIAMASLQALPSNLILDDGTCRFIRVSPSIVVATAGVGADGRIVAAAAQRLAVEHEYTFDEDIPVEKFLEEMSLLFQEYTIKQGARPFGCTLLVGYVPTEQSVGLGQKPTTPQLYQIDPSGSIRNLGVRAAIGSPLPRSVAAQLDGIDGLTLSTSNTTSTVESLQSLLESYADEFQKTQQIMDKDEKEEATAAAAAVPLRIVSAILTQQSLVIERIPLNGTKQ